MKQEKRKKMTHKTKTKIKMIVNTIYFAIILTLSGFINEIPFFNKMLNLSDCSFSDIALNLFFTIILWTILLLIALYLKENYLKYKNIQTRRCNALNPFC